MLFTLYSSKRQYICEECANTPEDFLRTIIERCLPGTPGTSILNSAISEMDSVETKINEIYDYIEKYDLPSITHKIEDGFIKMNNINNKIVENLSKLDKKIDENPCSDKEVGLTVCDEELKNKLESRIENTLEEIRSLKAAEKILMETSDEKDKKLMILHNEKERKTLKYYQS